MANLIFLFTGSALTIIWGIAHLFPTRSVVKDFGSISADNKQIITMEWIVEGIFLIFIGALCSGTTFIDPTAIVSGWVYFLAAGFLLIMALVSLFTGFRINFLPFKLCPVIFTVSAVLLAIGAFLS